MAYRTCFESLVSYHKENSYLPSPISPSDDKRYLILEDFILCPRNILCNDGAGDYDVWIFDIIIKIIFQHDGTWGGGGVIAVWLPPQL